MQRIAVAIFALIAIAVAQQVGPFPVPTILNSGDVINGVLPLGPQVSILNAQLYQIYVPLNASALSFTINNLDYVGPCGSIGFNARVGGLPCNEQDSYYDDDNYMCSNGWSFTTTGITTEIKYVGEDEELFDFPLGQWVYVAVSRTSGSYNNSNCRYTMNTSIIAPCAAGSVSVQVDYSPDVYACSPLAVLTSGTPVSITNPTATAFYNAYKIAVPQNTGHIRVWMNSTVSSTYVYGNSYSPATYNGDVRDCSISSGSSNGNFFIYSMICETPRAGDFYITVSNAVVSSMSLLVTLNTCAVGTGGYNCTAVSVPMNSTAALTTGAAVNVPGTGGSGSYGFSYLYFDVPANYTQDDITVSAVATTGTGYVYIRKDGFPEDDSSSGYESSNEWSSFPHSFTINQFDWAVAGRIYIGLQCSTTAGCVINVSGNKTAPVTSGVSSGVSSGNTNAISTGSNSGTGISTGGITTGTGSSNTNSGNTVGVTTAEAESSSVAALVPALFFAVVALLF